MAVVIYTYRLTWNVDGSRAVHKSLLVKDEN
jgi:hypothetical protein